MGKNTSLAFLIEFFGSPTVSEVVSFENVILFVYICLLLWAWRGEKKESPHHPPICTTQV